MKNITAKKAKMNTESAIKQAAITEAFGNLQLAKQLSDEVAILMRTTQVLFARAEFQYKILIKSVKE